MSVSECASDASADFTEYTMLPEESFFYEEFHVNNKENWPIGVVKTNKYVTRFFGFLPDPRTHYFYQDCSTQKLISQGTKNYGLTLKGFFNGSFLGWMKNAATLSDFDVYDNAGEYIGGIDGKLLTFARARFDFLNSVNEAIAYATIQETQIIINDAKTNKVIGKMERIFVDGKKDSWTIKITEDLDPRLVLIFSAHIVKNQSYFCKDR